MDVWSARMFAAAPMPSQIATWMQHHVYLNGPDAGEPQWLVALTETQPGDRMVVGEAGGRGLVLVVDFASSARHSQGSYYAWGAITPVERLVSFDQLRAGVFRPQRGPDLRWLRGGRSGCIRRRPTASTVLRAGCRPHGTPSAIPAVPTG